MATTDRTSIRVPITVETWLLPPAVADDERLAVRRAALHDLDLLVRRALQQQPEPLAPRTIELTIYDAIYAGCPEAGGHWTAAAARFGVFSHSVSTLAVTLLFDERDRPDRFRVSGATTVTSADVSEQALHAALNAVRRDGPAYSVSPNLFLRVGI